MRFYVAFDKKGDERKLKGIVFKMNESYSFEPYSIDAIKVVNERLEGEKCCKVESTSDEGLCFSVLCYMCYTMALEKRKAKFFDANGVRYNEPISKQVFCEELVFSSAKQ